MPAPETEFDTVAAAVARHAAARPEALAVADEAHELNWREFDALVDRVAAALQRDGVALAMRSRPAPSPQSNISRPSSAPCAQASRSLRSRPARRRPRSPR